MGEHRFNTRDHKTRVPKPESEHAVMAVPPSSRRQTMKLSGSDWHRGIPSGRRRAFRPGQTC
ncbi:hypothetical protein ABE453_03160 [Brevundimonas diminuta]|uniref:hypothetical protein n=1 Tax=Brevundimonas diminuta TaxID=293 RepID=UPI003209628E